MNADCRCPKSHDLNAAQPLKALHDKSVPVELISSLKSAYANIQALKYHDNKGNRGNYGHRGNRGNRQFRGGNRGHMVYRGHRGKLGSHQQQVRTHSTSDILTAIDLYGDDGDISGAASYTDASGDNGQYRKYTQDLNNTSASVRGRGGNRGNRGKQLQRTSSTSDVAAAISVLELMDFDGPCKGNSDHPQLMSPSSDISAAANCSPKRNPNKPAMAFKGRGGNRGNYHELQPTGCMSDVSAANNEGANSADEPHKRERQRPVRGINSTGDKSFR